MATRLTSTGDTPHHEDYRISGFRPPTNGTKRPAPRLGRGQHTLLRHDDLDLLIDGFLSHATSMVRPPSTLAIKQMSLISSDSRAILVPDEELAVASGHTKKLLGQNRMVALGSRFELSSDEDGRVQVTDPSGRVHPLAAIAMFRIEDEIGSSLAQMASVLLNHSEVPLSMSPETVIDLAATVAASIPINQFERGGGRVLRFVEQYLP